MQRPTVNKSVLIHIQDDPGGALKSNISLKGWCYKQQQKEERGSFNVQKKLVFLRNNIICKYQSNPTVCKYDYFIAISFSHTYANRMRDEDCCAGSVTFNEFD